MSIDKRLYALILAGLVFLACGTSRQVSGQTILQPVVDQVGEELARVLVSPDVVKMYILQNNPGTVEVVQDYYRKDEGKELCSSDVAVLRFLLTDNPANYEEKEGPIVSAPFLPFVEFFFQKGKDSISILVSTSDMTWSLVHNQKEIKNYPYTDILAVERLVNSLKD